MRLLKTVSFAPLLLGTTVSVAHAQNHSPKTAVTETSDQPSAAIRHKLASIIIPNTEFHATTLGDAIEFLRQEARRLDTDPDQDARGVNIFLKLPSATVSTGTPPSAATRITLTLSHLPLLEVLKYVAAQAGLKLRIEPYAISLVPPTENTDSMITATFRVSPTMIGNRTSDLGKTPLDEPATAVH